MLELVRVQEQDRAGPQLRQDGAHRLLRARLPHTARWLRRQAVRRRPQRELRVLAAPRVEHVAVGQQRRIHLAKQDLVRGRARARGRGWGYKGQGQAGAGLSAAHMRTAVLCPSRHWVLVPATRLAKEAQCASFCRVAACASRQRTQQQGSSAPCRSCRDQRGTGCGQAAVRVPPGTRQLSSSHGSCSAGRRQQQRQRRQRRQLARQLRGARQSHSIPPTERSQRARFQTLKVPK